MNEEFPFLFMALHQFFRLWRDIIGPAIFFDLQLGLQSEKRPP